MTNEYSRRLLVLESVEQDADDPTLWTGLVVVGGHPVRVKLGFGRSVPAIIEHVDVPTPLYVHRPSVRAVAMAMSRVVAGEDVALPLDLSDAVRSVDPPFPYLPLDPSERARLDAAADAVDLRVIDFEREASEPLTVRANLLLDGQPVTVRLRILTAPGAVPLYAWLRGFKPVEFTEAQRYAIKRALQRAADTS